MPLFEDQTPELIRSRVLERLESGLQTREGSYAYDMASPLAFELWRVLMTMGELVSAFYVDEYSGPYLDLHAALLGLERRDGARASCLIRFTGRDGVVIPEGTLFFTAEGLQYSLTEAVTLREGGGEGVAIAAEVGEAYNAPAGEVCRILRSLTGLESFAAGEAAGGADAESDAALFERITHRRKHPSASGNENHYAEWALSCEGIGAVKVTGLWNGPGTVRVLVTGYGHEPVDDALVAACAACIETQRPVGADVTVLSAGRLAVDVSAAVLLDGSVGLETVRAAFASALTGYFEEVTTAYFDESAVHDYTLNYKRVAALLICLEGVADFDGLTLNGAAENLTVGGTQVPVLGEVALA